MRLYDLILTSLTISTLMETITNVQYALCIMINVN